MGLSGSYSPLFKAALRIPSVGKANSILRPSYIRISSLYRLTDAGLLWKELV